jgi:hypothetical protein
MLTHDCINIRIDDPSAEVTPSKKRVKPDAEFPTNSSIAQAHPIEVVVGVVGDSSCTQCFEIA